MDSKPHTHADDYTKARHDMFAATNTKWARWVVALSDDEKRARLSIIAHPLGRVPYETSPRAKVKLPKRNVATTARPSVHPVMHVPAKR